MTPSLKTIALVLICVLFWSHKALAAANTFIMTCQFEPQTPLYAELEKLFTAAFGELDLLLLMQSIPMRRSIADVQRERADGNCLRIKELLVKGSYSHLVLVGTPLISITFDVWVLSEEGKYPNFSDLVDDGGRVGYERGVWIVERKLSALVPAAQLIASVDAKSGIEMLAAKRISAYVHSEIKVAEAIADVQKRRAVLVRRSGTLMSADLFPVLHEKHRSLAPKLALALQNQLKISCVEPLTELPNLCDFYLRQAGNGAGL